VRQAFQEAREGRPVVLAVTNHDFRDMRPDIDWLRNILSLVANEFPGVSFRFSEAVDAMRHALSLTPQPPCDLDMSLRAIEGSSHVLEVESSTPTFGPQPWLALKTTAGSYHCDNFDIEVPFHRWRYVFDEETFPVRALSAIGVAANNSFGIATVSSMDPATGKTSRKHWNAPDATTPRPA